MAKDSFPSDPSRRKVILVLTQHDIERCILYEPDAAPVLLDEEAHVLQFPAHIKGDQSPALRNIIDAGLARPNTILVQSPYETDTYEEVSLAPERFALAKHMHFSTLCMHLGASEVNVEQINQQTRTGKFTLDVRGDVRAVNIQGSGKIEGLDSLRAHIHLRDEFTGGQPDVEAAERLLRNTNLWGDPSMRTLVEMRREGSNQLMCRRLTLNLSSEAKNWLDVLGRLSVIHVGNLSAEFKSVVHDQRDYTLTVEVKFC